MKPISLSGNLNSGLNQLNFSSGKMKILMLAWRDMENLRRGEFQ